jgi:hypothetical protein
MSVEDKVEALRSNLKTDHNELFGFISAVQRHARTHQWEEGGFVYSFCKFYQKDLRDLVQYLSTPMAANENSVAKKQVASRVTADLHSQAVFGTEKISELSIEAPLQRPDIPTMALPSHSVHSDLPNSKMVPGSWVSYTLYLLGLGGVEPIPSNGGDQLLPPPASSEFESSGQTAIGYARAVACLFVPCDLAVRLAASLSARIMGGREL